MDHRPLSPASLAKCEDLLMRLARFYKYHGINIKTCYADFDKHHIGVVTESQVNISIVALINIHRTGDNCSIIYREGTMEMILKWLRGKKSAQYINKHLSQCFTSILAFVHHLEPQQ